MSFHTRLASFIAVTIGLFLVAITAIEVLSRYPVVSVVLGVWVIVGLAVHYREVLS